MIDFQEEYLSQSPIVSRLACEEELIQRLVLNRAVVNSFRWTCIYISEIRVVKRDDNRKGHRH